MAQRQALYSVIGHRDQILLDPHLRRLDWQPAYPEVLDTSSAIFGNRLKQNKIVLVLEDQTEAMNLYNKLQTEYKVVAFRNWL